MFFDQAWPERIEKFMDTTALEVGMFAQNLSSYLLEEKISPEEIKKNLEEELFVLSEAHYQRYFKLEEHFREKS